MKIAMHTFRVLSGLSQIELGRRIGRSQGYINRVECGYTSPGPADRKKLARVLKTDEAILFHDIDEGDGK